MKKSTKKPLILGVSRVSLVAEVGFERPTRNLTTFRGSRIVVCSLLRVLGSADSLLCAVNRCEKDTQSFSLRLQVIRPTFRPQGRSEVEPSVPKAVRLKSHSPKATTKKKNHPDGWFLFWLRRWDLNLTTSGLWARRATKLLYSAILCSRCSQRVLYHISCLLSTPFLLFTRVFCFIFSLCHIICSFLLFYSYLL